MPDLMQNNNSGGSVLTQNNRVGVLTTPLGQDVLCLVRFDGHEGLSEVFEFNVEAISEQEIIDFDKAIGQQCTVKISNFSRVREFTGILVETHSTGLSDQGEYFTHRITLRPWLWLLTRTTDCRVFHEKKAPDIIEQVFKDRGFSSGTDYELKLTDGGYPQREYTVQYRETDFTFVTRLMEKEGIYYYFEFKDGKHKLILADGKGSHKPVENLEKLPFHPVEGKFLRQEERLTHWTSSRAFRSGKFELNDYNYEKPNADMKGDAKGAEKYTRHDMEMYHYPGMYKEKSIGERYAKIELEAEQAPDHRRHGVGEALGLYAGGLTTLQYFPDRQQPIDSENIEYFVVRAKHTFGTQKYRTVGQAAEQEAYHGTYDFQPSSRPFRAPITTPKPRIHGIQTAKVVTKDDGGNEEIEVEKLTEIYVWFYWDRKQHDEPKRSCKIRVAQMWAQKKWGGQFIPRVGQEAVVEFLDGDPDRPLVVGTVYNDDNKPPYDLPDKKNIAGIKSNSTKGGNGYNEFHLDDTKMSEKIRMHAEKDHEVVIRHAETTEIGEAFEIPKGSPSRETTLKMGDDKLTISMGDQNVSIPLGSQKTDALIQIMDSVIASSITITPASISIMAPTIDLTAMATISLTAPVINITGIVNLTGVLNITGGITVNGMVPVLIPA